MCIIELYSGVEIVGSDFIPGDSEESKNVMALQSALKKMATHLNQYGYIKSKERQHNDLLGELLKDLKNSSCEYEIDLNKNENT